MNIFNHTQDSLSSNQTVESVGSDAILQLGRRIVTELECAHPVDTLSRWMAHYIAELIQNVVTSQGDDRTEKMTYCANAIMDLWKHRSVLPNGTRPFENFEPILRVLESLGTSHDTHRYFHSVQVAADVTKDETETKQWLDLAKDLDYTAKILIRYCLVSAAGHAIDKSKEWITLAKAINTVDEIDLRIVSVLRNENDLLNSPMLNEEAHKQVVDRIDRLNAFIKIASTLAANLSLKFKRLDKGHSRRFYFFWRKHFDK